MAEENFPLKAKNQSLPGFEKDKAGSWDGPFYFIQGADTQFGMIESYIEKKENPGWDKEIKLTKAAVVAINAMTPRPRFFVVCGDLIDAMPGTSLRIAQENDFVHTLKDLHPDIPLVCVCGNHDVGNEPTHESVQTYKDKFGDDYFTFYSAGVMFIVINSQFLKNSSLTWDFHQLLRKPSQATTRLFDAIFNRLGANNAKTKTAKGERVPDLAESQEIWLEEQLVEAKSGKYKHVIVFQHIPWFIHESDEENNYFNLDTEIRTTMLQKFHDANVRAIFCGHWHGNGGGFYMDLEVVVTSAVGAQLRGDKSGFRVVKLGENTIKHQYYAIEDAPKNIVID